MGDAGRPKDIALLPIHMTTALNTTLKRHAEIEEYIALCKQAGFTHRHDPPKNWDNYKAVQRVLDAHPDRNARVLDAGGIMASAFLPSLRAKGYTRLIALDLSNPVPPQTANGIVYRRGDITATEYPDDYFDAVGCLSVIEHGVDLEAFFREMSRVIRAGGSLIVSTDYWQTKIENSDGRRAYGVPVHIFSQSEMEELVAIAARFGFSLTGDAAVDYTCDERTIRWMGFEYTFIVLCFQSNET